MINYIFGLVIGIIACVAYVTIYKFYLGPLMEQEKRGTDIHNTSVLYQTWSGARIALTMLFGFGGFYMAQAMAKLIGWHVGHGIIGLYAVMIYFFAMVGWALCSWWLARFYLKKFAPNIYETYAPYYSPEFRQKIQALSV